MKPIILELVFNLGLNANTGNPQWKSEETNSRLKIVYVPDKHSVLQPSEEHKHFKAYRGRTVYENENQTFQIVSVDLFEIADPIKETVGVVEPEINLDDVEYDYELEFKRGKNTKTGVEQWESRVYDKVTAFTTLFVIDRDSVKLPTKNGDKFACTERREIFSDGESFAIVIVEPVALLDPDKLIVTFSDAIRKVGKMKSSTLTVIGDISSHRSGRSFEKRFADAAKRSEMKGKKLQDDSGRRGKTKTA
jgi:hypothetical protein